MPGQVFGFLGPNGAQSPAAPGRARERPRHRRPRRLSTLPSPAAAGVRLRSDALDVAVLDGREILLKKQPVSGSTSTDSTFAGALAELAGLVTELPAAAAASALAKGIAIPSAASNQPPRASPAASPGSASPS
jgi:hypothetical protein